MEVKEFVKTILKDVTEAASKSNNEKQSFYLPEEASDGIDFDLAVVSKQEGTRKFGVEVFGIGERQKEAFLMKLLIVLNLELGLGKKINDSFNNGGHMLKWN
ncbi:MAG: hypothetical protein NT076_02845 [Candidatus Pacearchaeota archaeon]|nr:hypothetical protein [Candidatus Pacearchaeota archaeon]